MSAALVQVRSVLSRRATANIVTLGVLAACLTFVTIATPYRAGPPIRSDGLGYHIWTRTILNWEPSICDWTPGYVKKTPDEICANQYPPGLALLRLPLMVWFIDTSSMPPAISPEEHQVSLIVGALVTWSVAALVLWVAAMLEAEAWLSGAIVLLCLFGTGLFHYGTYDSSFTHAHSAFFCALLCAFGVREIVRGKPMPITVLVASSFFLLSLRLTNIFLLALLCLAFAVRVPQPRSRLVRNGAFVALGSALAFALQLYVNYKQFGRLTADSYGNQSFLFDRPMQREVMLSFERGLFTYYPCFAVALIAGFAARGARAWTWLLLGLVACYVVLYGYWHSWMLGGGMGHRGFVELAPLVMITLCVSLSGARRLPQLAGLLAIALCSTVTLQVMFGYWNGTFPSGGADAKMYWRQVRLVESFATGGTQCRSSRCNLLRGRCNKRDEPAMRGCLLGLNHYGVCNGQGGCEPVMTLRSLDPRNSRPYVTAPPPRGKLLANGQGPGPWEGFLLVPVPDNPEQVWLRAMSNQRFVELPKGNGKTNRNTARRLEATALDAERAEKFVRVGSDEALSLRASNGKFVSAALDTDGRALPLRANASEPGLSERFALEIKP
jgi:hypothetical protein